MSHLAFCALVALGLARQAGKLRQRLEYLWHSCSGDITTQSDLFRLTYASETLKDQGWDNYVLSAKEWTSGVMPTPSQHNGFYVEKTALNAAFTGDGCQQQAVHFLVIGDAERFMHVMAEFGLPHHHPGADVSHTSRIGQAS